MEDQRLTHADERHTYIEQLTLAGKDDAVLPDTSFEKRDNTRGSSFTKRNRNQKKEIDQMRDRIEELEELLEFNIHKFETEFENSQKMEVQVTRAKIEAGRLAKELQK